MSMEPQFDTDLQGVSVETAQELDEMAQQFEDGTLPCTEPLSGEEAVKVLKGISEPHKKAVRRAFPDLKL